MITKRQADFALKLIKDWEKKFLNQYTTVADNDIDRLIREKETDDASTLATEYIYSLVDDMGSH